MNRKKTNKEIQWERYVKDCAYLHRGQSLDLKIDDYDCRIVRHLHLGHLCGYVILKRNRKISNCKLDLLTVHGGITYNAVELINGVFRRVIGFDCCHYQDYVPKNLGDFEIEDTETYKDIKYVKNEIKQLIKQLKELGVQ